MTNRSTTTTSDLLAGILADEAECRRVRFELVAELRISGWTWTRIADALGVSKQAAAKTYGEAADLALRRSMREARQIVGQTTVEDQIAETTQVVAVNELVSVPCLWSPGECPNPAYDMRFRLCDHHMVALDEADTWVSHETGEPGSVPCPVCPSEEGESCRTLPTYQPTRGKRPHAKRVALARA